MGLIERPKSYVWHFHFNGWHTWAFHQANLHCKTQNPHRICENGQESIGEEYQQKNFKWNRNDHVCWIEQQNNVMFQLDLLMVCLNAGCFIGTTYYHTGQNGIVTLQVGLVSSWMSTLRDRNNSEQITLWLNQWAWASPAVCISPLFITASLVTYQHRLRDSNPSTLLNIETDFKWFGHYSPSETRHC